jgi:hypothetical protein
MVLKYFYPSGKFDIEDVARKSVKHEKYGTTTIGLAKALREYGLRVDFYCRNIDGEALSDEDREQFLKKYGDYTLKERGIREKARGLGVNIVEKDVKLHNIEKALREERMVIPLVNWEVLTDNKGYQGHFIVMIGFDDENIFFHNPGPYHPEANMRATKELMEKARSYRGTILISDSGGMKTEISAPAQPPRWYNKICWDQEVLTSEYLEPFWGFLFQLLAFLGYSPWGSKRLP